MHLRVTLSVRGGEVFEQVPENTRDDGIAAQRWQYLGRRAAGYGAMRPRPLLTRHCHEH
jgi:hypothetical protein